MLAVGEVASPSVLVWPCVFESGVKRGMALGACTGVGATTDATVGVEAFTDAAAGEVSSASVWVDSGGDTSEDAPCSTLR